MKVIYKIIYPNGRIYIGQDRTDSINYYGSANSLLVAADFTRAQRQSIAVSREVLCESETATTKEITAVEIALVRHHRSNDPNIGYNRWPMSADGSKRAGCNCSDEIGR